VSVVFTDFRKGTERRLGRAMAKAVIFRHVLAEARFRFWVSPFGVCGGQSGTGTDFSPSFSVFVCHYHSTMTLHTECHLGDEQ
jgi:hypothetical protein